METFLRGMALSLALAGTAAAETGVGRNEIVLGQSAAFSGPSAGLGVEFWRGADACFSQVNQSGGIHGRSVRVVALDDGYEAARTLPNTLKLVDETGVFCLFDYVGTPTLVSALPVVVKHKPEGLFLFGNFSGAQTQREAPFNEVTFNVRVGYRQETAELVRAFVHDLGYSRIGVFMQNDPYGRSGLAGVRAALAAEKLPLAALASYPRNIPFETSMAEQVQALRGTQAVVLVGAYAQCAAFIRDARAAGYQGWFGAISFVGADQLLALLGKQPGDLTRRLAHSEVVPCWSDSGLKVVADYAQAMDADAAAKAPGDGSYTPASRSFGSLEGYIDARLFTEIAKEAGPALTRTAFQQAAAKAKVDLGGLEFSFDPEMKAVGGRAFLTVVRGGRWASAERLLP